MEHNDFNILFHDNWVVSIGIRRNIRKHCPMSANIVDIELQLVNDDGIEKTIRFKNCKKVRLNFPSEDVRQWSIFDVRESREDKSLTFTFDSLPEDGEGEAQLSFTYENYE